MKLISYLLRLKVFKILYSVVDHLLPLSPLLSALLAELH